MYKNIKLTRMSSDDRVHIGASSTSTPRPSPTPTVYQPMIRPGVETPS